MTNQMEYQLEKELSDREFEILQSELSQYNKSTGLTYLLWFFLGWIGIHQFYIGRVLWGVLYAGLCIGGWISVGVSIASEYYTILPSLLFGTLGILLLVDLFMIPSQIEKVRKEKKMEIINSIQSGSTMDLLEEIEKEN